MTSNGSSPTLIERVKAAPTWAKIVVPVVVLIVVAGALGASSEESDDGGGEPSADVQAAQERREAAAEKQEQREAQIAQCEDEIAPLISALEELDSRLSVGVQFADYTKYVGDTRVAYDQTLKDLSPDCVLLGNQGPAVEAERAMNIYINAGNTWNECIQDFGCDVDSIGLPQQFARAGSHIP